MPGKGWRLTPDDVPGMPQPRCVAGPNPRCPSAKARAAAQRRPWWRWRSAPGLLGFRLRAIVAHPDDFWPIAKVRVLARNSTGGVQRVVNPPAFVSDVGLHGGEQEGDFAKWLVQVP